MLKKIDGPGPGNLVNNKFKSTKRPSLIFKGDISSPLFRQGFYLLAEDYADHYFFYEESSSPN